jgi:hypothetical protein
MREVLRPMLESVRDNPKAAGRVSVDGGRERDDYIKLTAAGSSITIGIDIGSGRLEIQESDPQGRKGKLHRAAVEEYAEEEYSELVKAFLKRAYGVPR